MQRGRRVDEARRCIAEAAEVGCAQLERGCDDAHGYVRDRKGRIWQFNNLCLPDGLEELHESDAHPWGGWPLCDPLP
jgi:hypothetical protein